MFASISVDLDEINYYYEIHGLEAPRGNAVYEVALERLQALASAGRFPLTLFAIGRDLAAPPNAAKLRAASERGHEIANHSLDHRYEFVRLGRDAIARQIAGGADAIAEACGVRPVGFRAPGYTITDEVFDVLADLGVTYDASVFPCPAYWAAKTTAIGLIALRGRRSHSIVDTPNVLRAPTRPYRPGRPYWTRGRRNLVEIPVQVTRGPRLPFIGTSVTLAGPIRARWLARLCAGEPVVNLELHGIDVLDTTDGLEALRPYQPDVRIPWARKVDAILAAVEELRRVGYAFGTMLEAAKSQRV